MSIFRIHIIKIIVLLLFVTGIMLVAWPGKDRSHSGESVSAWLFELRSDTENPDVHNKINSLRTENGDIPGLLRKASTIIGEHSEDFTLPVENGDATNDDIYNTLLLKWTLHQKGEPSDTVMITDRQPQVPPANEKDDKSVWQELTNSVHMVVSAYSKISQAWDYIRMILRPLVSGVAINAP